uniref:Centrosomal protein of 162 kDa n=1 Tax=Chromera velia CCMP2878 TaxID=1169474 RepID=A0A0G4I9M5_9ALVE|eukprot:Cvel_2066.t1-p1 / transcript=Cvel_2066.t1 / gene=Cvel_2066 / organism=Chromera_velia_CCMP2878 / gene_product=hypothetical protein / transcript_product=hypothetical protein / location=Cvel_scaffold79:118570-131508(+) / protein_length=2327 / sequence_SO=supercontig / SO=protein_coding / is_pseudo=false
MYGRGQFASGLGGFLDASSDQEDDHLVGGYPAYQQAPGRRSVTPGTMPVGAYDDPYASVDLNLNFASTLAQQQKELKGAKGGARKKGAADRGEAHRSSGGSRQGPRSSQQSRRGRDKDKGGSPQGDRRRERDLGPADSFSLSLSSSSFSLQPSSESEEERGRQKGRGRGRDRDKERDSSEDSGSNGQSRSESPESLRGRGKGGRKGPRSTPERERDQPGSSRGPSTRRRKSGGGGQRRRVSVSGTLSDLESQSLRGGLTRSGTSSPRGAKGERERGTVSDDEAEKSARASDAGGDGGTSKGGASVFAQFANILRSSVHEAREEREKEKERQKQEEEERRLKAEEEEGKKERARQAELERQREQKKEEERRKEREREEQEREKEKTRLQKETQRTSEDEDVVRPFDAGSSPRAEDNEQQKQKPPADRAEESEFSAESGGAQVAPALLGISPPLPTDSPRSRKTESPVPPLPLPLPSAPSPSPSGVSSKQNVPAQRGKESEGEYESDFESEKELPDPRGTATCPDLPQTAAAVLSDQQPASSIPSSRQGHGQQDSTGTHGTGTGQMPLRSSSLDTVQRIQYSSAGTVKQRGAMATTASPLWSQTASRTQGGVSGGVFAGPPSEEATALRQQVLGGTAASIPLSLGTPHSPTGGGKGEGADGSGDLREGGSGEVTFGRKSAFRGPAADFWGSLGEEEGQPQTGGPLGSSKEGGAHAHVQRGRDGPGVPGDSQDDDDDVAAQLFEILMSASRRSPPPARASADEPGGRAGAASKGSVRLLPPESTPAPRLTTQSGFRGVPSPSARQRAAAGLGSPGAMEMLTRLQKKVELLERQHAAKDEALESADEEVRRLEDLCLRLRGDLDAEKRESRVANNGRAEGAERERTLRDEVRRLKADILRVERERDGLSDRLVGMTAANDGLRDTLRETETRLAASEKAAQEAALRLAEEETRRVSEANRIKEMETAHAARLAEEQNDMGKEKEKENQRFPPSSHPGCVACSPERIRKSEEEFEGYKKSLERERMKARGLLGKVRTGSSGGVETSTETLKMKKGGVADSLEDLPAEKKREIERQMRSLRSEISALERLHEGYRTENERLSQTNRGLRLRLRAHHEELEAERKRQAAQLNSLQAAADANPVAWRRVTETEKRVAELESLLVKMQEELEGTRKRNGILQQQLTERNEMVGGQGETIAAVPAIRSPSSREVSRDMPRGSAWPPPTEERPADRRVKELEEQLLKQLNDHLKKMNALHQRIKTYADRHAYVEAEARRIKEQEAELSGLRAEVERFRASSSSSTHLKKIAALEKHVSVLQSALEKKHPDSLAVLIKQSKPSVEETERVQQLQGRVKELEELIESREAEYESKVSALRAQFDSFRYSVHPSGDASRAAAELSGGVRARESRAVGDKSRRGRMSTGVGRGVSVSSVSRRGGGGALSGDASERERFLSLRVSDLERELSRVKSYYVSKIKKGEPLLPDSLSVVGPTQAAGHSGAEGGRERDKIASLQMQLETATSELRRLEKLLSWQMEETGDGGLPSIPVESELGRESCRLLCGSRVAHIIAMVDGLSAWVVSETGERGPVGEARGVSESRARLLRDAGELRSMLRAAALGQTEEGWQNARAVPGSSLVPQPRGVVGRKGVESFSDELPYSGFARDAERLCDALDQLLASESGPSASAGASVGGLSSFDALEDLQQVGGAAAASLLSACLQLHKRSDLDARGVTQATGGPRIAWAEEGSGRGKGHLTDCLAPSSLFCRVVVPSLISRLLSHRDLTQHGTSVASGVISQAEACRCLLSAIVLESSGGAGGLSAGAPSFIGAERLFVLAKQAGLPAVGDVFSEAFGPRRKSGGRPKGGVTPDSVTIKSAWLHVNLEVNGLVAILEEKAQAGGALRVGRSLPVLPPHPLCRLAREAMTAFQQIVAALQGKGTTSGVILSLVDRLRSEEDAVKLSGPARGKRGEERRSEAAGDGRLEKGRFVSVIRDVAPDISLQSALALASLFTVEEGGRRDVHYLPLLREIFACCGDRDRSTGVSVRASLDSALHADGAGLLSNQSALVPVAHTNGLPGPSSFPSEAHGLGECPEEMRGLLLFAYACERAGGTKGGGRVSLRVLEESLELAKPVSMYRRLLSAEEEIHQLRKLPEDAQRRQHLHPSEAPESREAFVRGVEGGTREKQLEAECAAERERADRAATRVTELQRACSSLEDRLGRLSAELQKSPRAVLRKLEVGLLGLESEVAETAQRQVVETKRKEGLLMERLVVAEGEAQRWRAEAESLRTQKDAELRLYRAQVDALVSDMERLQALGGLGGMLQAQANLPGGGLFETVPAP